MSHWLEVLQYEMLQEVRHPDDLFRCSDSLCCSGSSVGFNQYKWWEWGFKKFEEFRDSDKLLWFSEEYDTNALVDESKESWIGLQQTSGSWKWTDGSSLDFANWAPTQPASSAQCVQVGEFARIRFILVFSDDHWCSVQRNLQIPAWILENLRLLCNISQLYLWTSSYGPMIKIQFPNKLCSMMFCDSGSHADLLYLFIPWSYFI